MKISTTCPKEPIAKMAKDKTKQTKVKKEAREHVKNGGISKSSSKKEKKDITIKAAKEAKIAKKVNSQVSVTRFALENLICRRPMRRRTTRKALKTKKKTIRRKRRTRNSG